MDAVSRANVARPLDPSRLLPYRPGCRLARPPAIVRVYDFFEANGTAYMVMGLVEGENLSKRLLREGYWEGHDSRVI